MLVAWHKEIQVCANQEPHRAANVVVDPVGSVAHLATWQISESRSQRWENTKYFWLQFVREACFFTSLGVTSTKKFSVQDYTKTT